MRSSGERRDVEDMLHGRSRFELDRGSVGQFARRCHRLTVSAQRQLRIALFQQQLQRTASLLVHRVDADRKLQLPCSGKCFRRDDQIAEPDVDRPVDADVQHVRRDLRFGIESALETFGRVRRPCRARQIGDDIELFALVTPLAKQADGALNELRQRGAVALRRQLIDGLPSAAASGGPEGGPRVSLEDPDLALGRQGGDDVAQHGSSLFDQRRVVVHVAHPRRRVDDEHGRERGARIADRHRGAPSQDAGQ